MKLLVDGRSLRGTSTERSLLEIAMTGLAAQLPGWDLTVLVRWDEPSAPWLGFRPLPAPPKVPSDPVGEDRRLAALCKVLNIDVFFGSDGVSAGGAVATVQLDWGRAPGRISRPCVDRAARLAAIRLTPDPHANGAALAVLCADAARRALAGETEHAGSREAEERAIEALAARQRMSALRVLVIRQRAFRWSARFRSAFGPGFWKGLPRRLRERRLRK